MNRYLGFHRGEINRLTNFSYKKRDRKLPNYVIKQTLKYVNRPIKVTFYFAYDVK